MPHPEADLLVICNRDDRRQQAAALAQSLGVPLLFNLAAADLSEPTYALVIADKISLQQTGRKVPGPVAVDFFSGAVEHRRRFGGGKGQMIAKACGVQGRCLPYVLDATAGLGRDGFVLASLGCRVQLLERSPLVFALLDDGLARAHTQASDCEQTAIVQRMQLTQADARQYLAAAQAGSVDVVYLDPMFPERQKTADVKKEMRAFHQLVGADEDAAELLDAAMHTARYRVVVKRPRKAPDLAGRSPSFRLEGKSSRFDIYALKKMPG
ncbi:MAG TPA: class I SAM-dependent methyltransferase [Cellvibrionaceae bacterium]